MKFKPGSLVNVRNRDWIVLPSNDEDLVLLKPLGGSEEEITGIYLPLEFDEDNLISTEFPLPTEDDIGSFPSAKLLYNASRLSFRDGAGPFRSLAKLSFRPRSYQMVPLIMALKQQGPTRLLIADDVGVGKTVESLLVLKELLERKEIKRFAIIVLPHLCEQWHAELKDKFGIDAVVIRTNTQARLDREIPDDTSVYHYYPHQIISIDYIKSEQRRQVFVQDCPEFVIVDEAHSCLRAENTAQQQRYRLINDIASKPNQHMVYLTATPHSGKPAQFQSLLGLIKKDYNNFDLTSSNQNQRRDLAQHYVQRRRADVVKCLGEDTPFPEREAGEYQYKLSPKYAAFYSDILDFALGLTKKDGKEREKRFRYWSALALLRGVMSSPVAGVDMLKNRIKNSSEDETVDDSAEQESNPVIDEDFSFGDDFLPSGVISKTPWSESENKTLNKLANQLSELQGIQYDYKVSKTLEIIKQWLKEGFNPVIFCRFIATANYVGETLKAVLGSDKSLDIQVITSEDHDEVRKVRIGDMKSSKKRILIATDCLSEGINLQELFTAVLHYDLPWNPNRLEQREGRVDRYGQTAKIVKAFLLWGENNPIDGVVLKVLLRKVREIRKSTGISIPFPEDSKSLMDSVLQAVLSSKQTLKATDEHLQQSFDFGIIDEVKEKEITATNAIEKAAEREKISRNIFAQNAIKDHEIEEDLKESDEAIGTPESVETFVTESLSLLGTQITLDRSKDGYTLFLANLPVVLKNILSDKQEIKVSFYSPTPEGYLYLGRNHPFVEQLCQFMLANSLNSQIENGPARISVIRCKEVSVKTTLLLFRVRNVIEGLHVAEQLVAEEMLLWGYRGSVEDENFLDIETVKDLMENSVPSSPLSKQAQTSFLETELKNIHKLRESKAFDTVAIERAELLIKAHERFRKVLGGMRYKVVEPILPMDLMGVYILLPDNQGR